MLPRKLCIKSRWAGILSGQAYLVVDFRKEYTDAQNAIVSAQDKDV